MELILQLDDALDTILDEIPLPEQQSKTDEEIFKDYCNAHLNEKTDQESIKELIGLYAWALFFQRGCPAAECAQEGVLEFLGCDFLFDLVSIKPKKMNFTGLDEIKKLAQKKVSKNLDILYQRPQFELDEIEENIDCADLVYDFFDGSVSKEECFNLVAYMYTEDSGWLAEHPLYLDLYLRTIGAQIVYKTLPKNMPDLSSINNESARIFIEKVENYVRRKGEEETSSDLDLEETLNNLTTFKNHQLQDPQFQIKKTLTLRPDKTLPNGIENGGNTCYMDSVIVAILATISEIKNFQWPLEEQSGEIYNCFFNLVKDVLGEETKTISRDQINKLRVELQKKFPESFGEMWRGVEVLQEVYFSNREDFENLLLDVIEDPSTQAKAQEDAASFLSCLLNPECLGSFLLSNQNHCFKQWRTFIRPNEPLLDQDVYDYNNIFNTVLDDQHYSPIVPIKIEGGNNEMPSLGQLLMEKKFSQQTVHIYQKDDVKKYKEMELFCLQQPTIFSSEEAPSYFIAQLGRFGYDQQAFKRQDRVLVSEIVTLPICDKETLYVTEKGVKYELIAVVVHHGMNPTAGHYVTYQKKEDMWYLHDDMDGVSLASNGLIPEAVITDGYLFFYKKIDS